MICLLYISYIKRIYIMSPKPIAPSTMAKNIHKQINCLVKVNNWSEAISKCTELSEIYRIHFPNSHRDTYVLGLQAKYINNLNKVKQIVGVKHIHHVPLDKRVIGKKYLNKNNQLGTWNGNSLITSNVFTQK